MPLLPVLLLLGCHAPPSDTAQPDTDKTGDTGDGGGDCVGTTTVVDSAEVTPLGFSAQDLIAQVGGLTSQPLSWLAAGEDTTLTTGATWDGGEVRFVDGERSGTTQRQPDTGATPCGDALEVDVSLAFSTDDGVFAESWPLTLQAYEADSASYFQDLGAVTLAGTFDKWAYADPTADYESLTAEVGGILTPGGGIGWIVLTGKGWADPECQTAGCAAWESLDAAATWDGTVN